MGTSLPALRSARVASRPSSRGIITSMTMMSGSVRGTTASASAPSDASSTVYPLNSRERRSESRTARSSSTTRMRMAPVCRTPLCVR